MSVPTTQVDAKRIAKDAFVAKLADSLEYCVYDSLPESCTAYGLPAISEPCWWVAVHSAPCQLMLDGPLFFSCISKNNGEILWSGYLQSGG